MNRIPRQPVAVLSAVFLLAALAILVVITAARAWIWWRNDAGVAPPPGS